MRGRLAIAGSLVFSLATALALCLIFMGKFSGAEFSAFVIAFAVLGLVVGFAPEVQEISIVGNIVKLKEVKSEALKAIESLNKSRIEMLRVLLGLALKHGGMFGDSNQLIDPRAHELWPLFRLSKDYSCQKELKTELSLCLSILMRSQLTSIKWRNRNASILDSEPFLSPVDLASFAFDVDGISRALLGRGFSLEDYRNDIKISLEEYSRLYEFYVELEAL